MATERGEGERCPTCKKFGPTIGQIRCTDPWHSNPVPTDQVEGERDVPLSIARKDAYLAGLAAGRSESESTHQARIAELEAERDEARRELIEVRALKMDDKDAAILRAEAEQAEEALVAEERKNESLREEVLLVRAALKEKARQAESSLAALQEEKERLRAEKDQARFVAENRNDAATVLGQALNRIAAIGPGSYSIEGFDPAQLAQEAIDKANDLQTDESLETVASLQTERRVELERIEAAIKKLEAADADTNYGDDYEAEVKEAVADLRAALEGTEGDE